MPKDSQPVINETTHTPLKTDDYTSPVVISFVTATGELANDVSAGKNPLYPVLLLYTPTGTRTENNAGTYSNPTTPAGRAQTPPYDFPNRENVAMAIKDIINSAQEAARTALHSDEYVSISMASPRPRIFVSRSPTINELSKLRNRLNPPLGLELDTSSSDLGVKEYSDASNKARP